MSEPLLHEHVFVPPAPGPGSPAYALLALHGTGGDEHDLLPLAKAVAPGAAILSPRGRVLEGTMPRFFRRLREGVFDLPDLLARTDELADFVAAARARYAIADRPLIALGYSNGANIAAAMLLRRPGVLAGAALLRAMPPFEVAAAERPDLRGIRVLALWGRQDPTIPARVATELAELLEGCGATLATATVAHGHGLERSDLEITANWLKAPEA